MSKDVREAYGDVREMVFGLDVRSVAMVTASNRPIIAELGNVPPATMMCRSGPMSAQWRLHPLLVSYVRDLLVQQLDAPTKADLPDRATQDEVGQASRQFLKAVAELAATVAATAPADTRKIVDGTEWTRPALNGWSSPEVDALVEEARATMKTWSLLYVRVKLDEGRA